MFHSKSSRIVAIMILVLILGSGSALGQKWGKITDEEKLIGPPADYPEANSIILFDKGHIEIKRKNIRIDYHVRIKVLTVDGIDEVGNQSIVYNDKYDKIKNFKAHTITPEGKKIKVEKDAIFDKTVGNRKEKTFAFPSVGVGSIVEYKYSHISDRHYYLRPWYFQNKIYTLKSEVAVTIPTGFTYTVQYQNMPPQFRDPVLNEILDPDESYPGAKIKTFVWTRENLPPVTDEPYMSAEDDYRSALRFRITLYENPYVHYSYEESWPELGAFRQQTLDEYCNVNDEVRKLAEEITAGLTTDIEKSMALHTYVANSFKTSSDYNSKYFMHDKMSKFLAEKHGTGEEKNLLLCELHMALDMPAFPVLISRRSHGKFYADFAYLPQFDYLIAFVQLGNDYDFIDASSKLSPYGVLPPNCLVDGGLLIDGEKSQLVRIREKTLYSGRTDLTRIHITADGTAACSTSCSFRGYYASLYGNRHEINDPVDFVEDYFLDKLDMEYILGEHECVLDSTHEFVLKMDYTSDEIVEQLDNNLIVKIVSYGFRDNPFKSEKRFFPVDFQYPFTYRNVMKVVVDGEVQESVLPEDLTYSCSGATFERKTTVQDSVVVVDSKLIIEKPQFLPNLYNQLRKFFDEVSLSSEDELAFVMAGTE